MEGVDRLVEKRDVGVDWPPLGGGRPAAEAPSDAPRDGRGDELARLERRGASPIVPVEPELRLEIRFGERHIADAQAELLSTFSKL